MKKGFIGQRSAKINIGGNTAKSPTFIPTLHYYRQILLHYRQNRPQKK